MVRSVAIMYQVYVIASAQSGTHYQTKEGDGGHLGRSSWGESLAFDPWGRELAKLPRWDELSNEDKSKRESTPLAMEMVS